MRRRLAAGLALLVSACSPAPPDAPALQRPDLGVPAFVSLGGVARPALALRPGESRRARVQLAPGSSLVLGLGGTPEAPRGSQLRLDVLLDGQPVATLRSPSRAPRWATRRVALQGHGWSELELRAGSRPLQGGQDPDAPFVAVAAPRLHAPSRGGRRVLVWISQDALRADHLGAYGYPRPTSPRFDALAAESGLFEQAWSTSSWTLPALASQFTARNPSFHGAVLHTLSTDAPTLFAALARDGFSVFGVTGNELVSPENGLAAGHDVMVQEARGGGHETDALLELLEEWPGGDLALFVHYIDPHVPYAPSAAFRQRFVDPGYAGSVDGRSSFPKDFPQIGPADRKRLLDLYDAEIAQNDAEIARLLETLDRRGLLADAAIVYTADHGEEFFEHGGWLHGSKLTEEVLRVPLAIRLPRLGPRRIAEPVSTIDIAPTLLEAFSLPPLPGAQGRSLLPALRGQRLPRRPVFAETLLTRDHERRIAVRSGPDRAAFAFEREADPEAPPLESEFPPGVGAAERQRLEQLVVAYLRRARAEGSRGRPVDLSPETIEKLKAWGYIQ